MEKWWSIQERWLVPGPSTSPIESENTAQEHEKFEVVMAKPCQRWCLKRRIWGMSQNYGLSKSIGFLDQPFVGANLVGWVVPSQNVTVSRDQISNEKRIHPSINTNLKNNIIITINIILDSIIEYQSNTYRIKSPKGVRWFSHLSATRMLSLLLSSHFQFLAILLILLDGKRNPAPASMKPQIQQILKNSPYQLRLASQILVKRLKKNELSKFIHWTPGPICFVVAKSETLPQHVQV